MDKKIKIYYRVKCSLKSTSLGYHHVTYLRVVSKNTKVREHISIFLPRILRISNIYNLPFSRLFSHTVSHELIHKLINDSEGASTSTQFDNIAGTISFNLNKIGIGMNINMEE